MSLMNGLQKWEISKDNIFLDYFLVLPKFRKSNIAGYCMYKCSKNSLNNFFLEI